MRARELASLRPSGFGRFQPFEQELMNGHYSEKQTFTWFAARIS
jgi:hypothetical protein